jgi:tRNA dimethylallyltransferase
MPLPKLLVIVGPTASGKTALALSLARQFGGELIAADSRTVYRGMDIGTAKPVGVPQPIKNERGSGPMDIKNLVAEQPIIVEGVAHWGLDLVAPDEEFTVSDFKKYCQAKITEIVARGRLPILVGGTGLYIRAVVDNLSLTETPPNLELRGELEQLTNAELIERLEVKDPDTLETIDVLNRRRLVRALEIVETTRQPLAASQTKGEPKYDLLEIGCEVERDELMRRIDERVDGMVASGLVNEVRALKEKYGCDGQAMTGIGYRQICQFLQGYVTLRDGIELLKRDSRAYAKRQLTWFRRDERIHWIKERQEAINLVANFYDHGAPPAQDDSKPA